MLKVKLSSFPHEPIIRQTPGSRGIWGNCQFFINEDIEECDYWVVYDGLKNEESALCPLGNTILLAVEPPSVFRYEPDFIQQFSTVLTCPGHNFSHPRLIYYPAFNWYVGRVIIDIRQAKSKVNLDYDDFKGMEAIEKNKLISLVCSNKQFTAGHRKRLAFVERLMEHFGSRIERFGTNINYIEDKWDAIKEYKYHIAIENSSFPHYWTEKIADCYLAGAYPLYYGCPNLGEYFPQGAYTCIDIDDVETAISSIEECLAENRYEKNLDKIWAARKLVLDYYNLFAVIERCILRLEAATNSRRASKIPTTIRPCPEDWLNS
ncbi:MAG: glycosyltransferase family 10 [Syntrophomonas sp.]|uniref:glycosyltransferase family 10 domain-containing protein n=1 Tax=Syntrophomonas sp. TaxID=2053627 RepID=UPI00262D5A40|nr:glycosyltransferase family 10 [Syntrophomonas sp.]MDD2510908.1 glycosyltransferase family 10 [Syntrophomonas sp.]MDD3879999.1 glycosyltransferase family 10 [Syntrophomonas sp.]MDD4626556.1 glycosyltransferase family 10 [Syntrophomonas sp.]